MSDNMDVDADVGVSTACDSGPTTSPVEDGGEQGKAETVDEHSTHIGSGYSDESANSDSESDSGSGIDTEAELSDDGDAECADETVSRHPDDTESRSVEDTVSQDPDHTNSQSPSLEDLFYIDVQEIVKLPDGAEKDEKVENIKSTLSLGATHTRMLEGLQKLYRKQSEELEKKEKECAGLTEEVGVWEWEALNEKGVKAGALSKLIGQALELRRKLAKKNAAFEKRGIKIMTLTNTIAAKDKEIQSLNGRVDELETAMDDLKLAHDVAHLVRGRKRARTED
jgi:hypothetical protein